jgi:hypothetical protein
MEQRQSWQRCLRHRPLKLQLMAAGLALLLTACGGGSKGSRALTATIAPTATTIPTPTPAPTATMTPTPTLSPAQIAARFKASTQQVTVADIAKDPNFYQGANIQFGAIILNFVQDSSGDTVGANVYDPNDETSVIQIVFSPLLDITQINRGDVINVWRQGLGAASGQNAFGANITEGVVQEFYLHDETTGYSDAP